MRPIMLLPESLEAIFIKATLEDVWLGILLRDSGEGSSLCVQRLSYCLQGE